MNKRIMCIILFIVYGFIENSCLQKTKISSIMENIKAQVSSEDMHLLSEIPLSLRESFIRRINLLIAYESKHNWKDLYNLLYSKSKSLETMDKYCKRRNQYKQSKDKFMFIDYKPKIIVERNDDIYGHHWRIEGCIIESNRINIKKYYGGILGFYEKGDWYFDDIPYHYFTAVGGDIIECK